MNYVYVFARIEKGTCVLSGLQKVSSDYQMLRGITRESGFPADARFDMDNDFGIKLQDVIKNRKKLLVISERLKDFLKVKELKNNETLPVVICDLKKRPVKNRYFILHQIILQDCLDLVNTVAERSPIDPEFLMGVRKIALDERRIDPDVMLFRPKHYPGMVIVHRELAERITSAGFTGIGFKEIDQYDQLETL